MPRPWMLRGWASMKYERSNLAVLSRKEPDRRWNAVSDLMNSEGVEYLILAGLYGWEVCDAYLTSEGGRGILIVPREGEGTQLAPNELSFTGHTENLLRGGLLV
jgi:hypothetical protein